MVYLYLLFVFLMSHLQMLMCNFLLSLYHLIEM